jgi:hypothetical protein
LTVPLNVSFEVIVLGSDTTTLPVVGDAVISPLVPVTLLTAAPPAHDPAVHTPPEPIAQSPSTSARPAGLLVPLLTTIYPLVGQLTPALDEITPLDAVIVVPSTFTTPKINDDALATVIAPEVSVMIVPSGFTHPICVEVAVVQEIVPLVIVKVLPSPCTPPTAADVAKGRSAETNARNDGCAASPLLGPAKTVLAD